ncbi:MAG: PmoA family protein [Dysgonamonadaceae bacterium]|jgi:hypothetical protein|nr:PmoA family protein [Dysgonamonadaceae bacterium]
MKISHTIASMALMSFVFTQLQAEEIITLKVNSDNYTRENSIVCLQWKQTQTADPEGIELAELINGKKVKTECQLEKLSDGTRLYWILSGRTPANTTRIFLVKTKNKPQTGKKKMHLEDKNGGLILKESSMPVIQYQYRTVYPPAGIDTAYKRSGFIHPAWSPAGDTLTTIQPKDHYHHYGIWNPWTKLEYNGEIYDLWNLRDRKGTVKFESFKEKTEGPVFTGFKALQGHYIFPGNQESQAKEIMEEIWDVKVWNQPKGMGFLWDFGSELHPNTTLPVILKAYRYAGFSIRATEVWTKDNSIMLTSEGKNRPEIDGTKARWIYLTGECKNGKAGILFMSHPNNYNAPEPLRIWDQNANGGRGDAFMNFAPTKDIDWTLEAGKKYRLNYRIFQYNGEMTPAQAEQFWTDYANPVKIEVIK